MDNDYENGLLCKDDDGVLVDNMNRHGLVSFIGKLEASKTRLQELLDFSSVLNNDLEISNAQLQELYEGVSIRLEEVLDENNRLSIRDE